MKKQLATFEQAKGKMQLKGFWGLSIAILIVLTLFYIYQVNAITNQSYNISILEQKAKKMTQVKEGLEVKLTQEQYLPNATKLAADLQLEKIDRIEYINPAKPVAAAK